MTPPGVRSAPTPGKPQAGEFFIKMTAYTRRISLCSGQRCGLKDEGYNNSQVYLWPTAHANSSWK